MHAFTAEIIELSDAMGLGLPLSRLYAEYFGGSLEGMLKKIFVILVFTILSYANAWAWNRCVPTTSHS